MRSIILVPLLLVVSLGAAFASDEPLIDIARGKQLMRRFQAGETLTPEEQGYLDRVKQEIRKRAGGKPAPPASSAPARPFPVNPDDWTALVPLTDMTTPYKGEDGGLYGGGHEPPAAHRAVYLKESEQIRPLDARGQPSEEGKIGLISIGFSNSSIEWEESGFGTRWVVQSQIRGDAVVNCDPARGAVKSPLVLWGPYLWACGNAPRKLDGMTWTQNDVRADQLRPNEAGCRKTTTLLLNFFKTDTGASRWFLKSGEQGRATPLPR